MQAQALVSNDQNSTTHNSALTSVRRKRLGAGNELLAADEETAAEEEEEEEEELPLSFGRFNPLFALLAAEDDEAEGEGLRAAIRSACASRSFCSRN